MHMYLEVQLQKLKSCISKISFLLKQFEITRKNYLLYWIFNAVHIDISLTIKLYTTLDWKPATTEVHEWIVLTSSAVVCKWKGDGGGGAENSDMHVMNFTFAKLSQGGFMVYNSSCLHHLIAPVETQHVLPR